MLGFQCFFKERGLTTTLPRNHVGLIFGFYHIWLTFVRFECTFSVHGSQSYHARKTSSSSLSCFSSSSPWSSSSFFFPSFLSLLCNSCPPQVDDEPFPNFTFVKESCEVYNGMINWSILKFEVLNPRERFQFVCCTRRHDVRKDGLLTRWCFPELAFNWKMRKNNFSFLWTTLNKIGTLAAQKQGYVELTEN